MKILFFSDCHGVPTTLEALFRQAERRRPDLLVFLGDALYHGPRNGVPPEYDPQRAVTLFNAHREQLLAVRGNCDCEVDQMLLQFPIMAEYSEVLADGRRFFLTHGHLWNAEHVPPVPTGTILVQGHTHIPECRELPGGITLFNAGSISLPKAGSSRSFGFFDGRELSLHALDEK